MFTVKYTPSTSHWIVPPIIMGILVILIIVMLIQGFVKAKKEKRSFIQVTGKKFFEENWDKIKLFGTLVLFIFYIFAMEQLGFLIASIIFIFMFNLLFAGIELLKEIPKAFKEKSYLRNIGFRSVCISMLISVIFSVGIWFLFGEVFSITLP
ncbi:MAG: tripartite tricarboxylate transporter TctB family protein [Velocimicrobium sp.]